MAGPEKQRTKGNQSTKAFARNYWTNLMDKAKQDFNRDLLAKGSKKTSSKSKSTYSLEKGMTSLAARAKAAGLSYDQPMKAAKKEKSANQKKNLYK